MNAIRPVFLTCLLIVGCNSEPTTPREQAEQAQEDLQAAREQATRIINESEEEAVDIVADAREAAREQVQDAKQEAADIVADAEQNLNQKLDALSRTVNDGASGGQATPDPSNQSESTNLDEATRVDESTDGDPEPR